jgi:outer membrane protein assembly factor BamC
VNQTAKLGLLCLTATLAACTTVFDTERIDYRSNVKGPTLDVPPDLTQLSKENRYAMPGGVVTASGYLAASPLQNPTVAATAVGDVRIERAGTQRWLVVDRPADKLWQPIHDFWIESGFTLVIDQANLGIMETEWNENRAKLPQDFVRKAIGGLLDGIFSTGERDKFRTRLERTSTGATEIYISHRGMMEVYGDKLKDTTVWQPRAVDPELETEFLRRLMIKLGSTNEVAQVVANASAPAKPSATITTTINGLPGLEIADGFDRAWRRVGLALDRTGFTVEDRDRSQGTYFVRYVESGADKKGGNFFSKLFSFGAETESLQKFRVILKSAGEKTTLTVISASATPETAANAKRIAQLIADDLK